MTGKFAIAALLLSLCSGAVSAREMNISQFVFRDVNRNGIFDIGESPFAGAEVIARHTSDYWVAQNTNLAGFANFPMSDDEPDKDITQPGEWQMSIVVPDGFELTTDNPVQTTQIEPMKQSPGGFVADPPLPFIGIAPVLTIEADIAPADRLTCANGITTIEATINTEFARFSCRVGPGTWTVTWHQGIDEAAQRSVVVKDWPVRVPFPQIPVAAPGPDDEIVSFDDIIQSENIQEVQSGHGGVNWYNLIAAHRKFYSGWGYVNGTISGEFSAYNSSGHPARLYYRNAP